MSSRTALTFTFSMFVLNGLGIEVEPLHPPPGSPIINRIITPGVFHGNEMTARDGSQWLGLFRGPSGYWLSLVPIRVKPALDPILDDLSGKSVAVDGKRVPIFLLKGFTQLANRAVRTFFDGEFFFAADQRMTLNFGNGKFVLGAEPNGKFLKLDDGTKFVIQQIYLEQGEDRFRLPLTLAAETDSGVALLWAGDLDGDGKPDFLFTHTGANSSATRLFLSSAAKAGEPLAEVAFHLSTVC